MVGHLLHRRGHRDEHADVHRCPCRRYAGNMTFLQLAAGYVVGRVIVSVLFLPAYFAASSSRPTSSCSSASGRPSRPSPPDCSS